MNRILFCPDPPDPSQGGDPVPAPAPSNPQPPAPGPSPAPAEPKAARTVLDGKTEREIALENKLAEQEARTKKAETLASEWQDQAKQLKERSVAPASPKKRKSAGVRLTLLHPIEEE